MTPPLGLCYGSLSAVDADTFVAIAGAAGFTSVMLPPFPESTCATRAEFRALLDRHGIRRVVLDGAMGTLLQRHAFTEADFRGVRFADHDRDVRGDNDLAVEVLLTAFAAGQVMPLLLAGTAAAWVPRLLALRALGQWVPPISGVVLLATGTLTLLARWG
jgi:hypothetical protein